MYEVPSEPAASERKIEWLLSKTGKESMFVINLLLLPMANCKSFEKLLVPHLRILASQQF